MTEHLDFMGSPLESEDDFNLTAVHSDGAVLLGEKNRGYGKNLLVLVGGKTRRYLSPSGEHRFAPVDEAAREVNEETGFPVEAMSIQPRGILHISTEEDVKQVRLFEAHTAQAEPYPSSEFDSLEWYDERDLPYDRMPHDYQLWLPHTLAGYAVTAFFEVNCNDKVVDGQVFRQRIEPLGRAEQIIV